GILPLPASFRQWAFSLPCVFATFAPSLLIPFRHFCWVALCCANATSALTSTGTPTTATLDSRRRIDMGVTFTFQNALRLTNSGPTSLHGTTWDGRVAHIGSPTHALFRLWRAVPPGLRG